MNDSLTEARKMLHKYADLKKAKFLAGFFKTGKGEYGDGDMFIGVTVPNTRKVAKVFYDLGKEATVDLLQSPIHEERFLALLILIYQYQKVDDIQKVHIAKLYLNKLKYVNNWDLVDLSAHKILGPYCKKNNTDILLKLATSKNFWERRVAMITCAHFIAQGESKLALEIATILKDDAHDLIQKAVGWMLREIGNRCGQNIEESFLDKWAVTMPRTMLRYALEKFPPDRKIHYMGLK
ncbi:MAG: DNA alkylation repair protein [bacterium]|nr:DNA alkylation repair protein [bacterium]